MNKKTNRLLALCLAVLMVFSLAACEGSGGEGGSGGSNKGSGSRVTPVVNSPKEDAAGYLAMATENTYMEIAERYSGSPLAAVFGALDTSGKLSLSGEIDAPDANMDISDLSLEYDLDAKTLLASLNATSGGIEVSGGACISPDFIGVSFPMLLGDDDYYGVKPQNLADQLRGSSLWEMMEGELDMSQVEMLDDMLDTLWNAQLIDSEQFMSDMQELVSDYITGLDLDYEEDTVDLDGEDVDGYVFTASVTADDLLDLMDGIYDIILDMPLWDAMLEVASAAGEDISREDFRRMMDQSIDQALDEMSGADLEMDYTFYVADGKLVRTEAVSSSGGVEAEITLNFYDDGSITAFISSDGEEIEVSSVVESKKRSYFHELSVTAEGETMTVTTEWDGDELTLETEVPYEGTFSLSCGLSATRKGFTIENLSVDDGYETADIPLTLEYTSGGSVSTPRNTNNLLTLDEEELRELVTGIMDIAGSLDLDW